ncbi:unnamed protein product, partial [Mycena citricolor]
ATSPNVPPLGSPVWTQGVYIATGHGNYHTLGWDFHVAEKGRANPDQQSHDQIRADTTGPVTVVSLYYNLNFC